MAIADDHQTYLHHVYDRWVQGDLTPLYERLADDVDWRSIGSDGALPWSGAWPGRAGVEGYFRALIDNLDIVSFRLVDMLGDDRQVACLCRVVCGRKGAGPNVEIEKVDLFGFEGGRIVKFWEIYGMERLAAAFNGTA